MNVGRTYCARVIAFFLSWVTTPLTEYAAGQFFDDNVFRHGSQLDLRVGAPFRVELVFADRDFFAGERLFGVRDTLRSTDDVLVVNVAQEER
ncbi:hypothetical protein [Corynebacterium aquatimens]|uniref:hypothetical protein n=1 Tax=Corynebacterium aquatimens TaxID=1190508 RepID=UPI003611E97D